MRVTANTFSDALVSQLNTLTVRQSRLQNQVATGQRIQLPEDDPASIQRTLDFQTEAKAVAQYKSNIANLTETAQANYGVMTALKKISDRAGELATQADGTKSPAELKLYGTELTQLIQQGVQLAQTQFKGNYLLSGTRSDQAPFSMTTGADGSVTSVTYQGNQTVHASEVAEGVTLSADVLGANSAGSGPRGLISDSRFGADFFNHLIALQNHLLAGDTAAIAATDRPSLAKDEDNLVAHLGSNGALQSRLEASTSVAASRASSLEGLISKESDVDLAQTLVRLNQTQNAYQAALQSGAKLLSLSILDYLR